MNDLDVTELLGNHTEENPSGEDLEYDADFIEMESAAQGKPEQQYGETIIPAEPPDWKSVEVSARNVLKRSHDLRAATHLANAMLVQHGLGPFSQVIQAIKKVVLDFWPSLHPQLDADDDNDPTIRVNTLMSLCDNATTLQYLSHAMLVEVRAIGRFSLFDWKVAHGELTWPGDNETPAPDKSLIEAAFQDCELEELDSKATAATELVNDLKEIEDFVTTQVGAAQSCNFENLVKEATSIQHILNDQLKKRTPETPVEQVEPSGAEETPSSAKEATPAAKGFTSVNDLVVKTRQEAIIALDKICEYYERYEPSSPLPLLLKRARRLSNKSFLEIIRDISPDVLQQVESLGGLDDNLDGSTPGSSTPGPPTEYENSGSSPDNSGGDTY